MSNPEPTALVAVDDRYERSQRIRAGSWVEYPLAHETLVTLDTILRWPLGDERVPCLLLTGIANNGKTRILKEFVRRNVGVNSPKADAAYIPVVRVQAPAEASEDKFYSAILRFLQAPETSARLTAKEDRVLKIMRAVGTRVLIIDEVHNIISGPTAKQQTFRTSLRYLANDLGIGIIAAGTLNALHAIQADAQLKSRFQHKVKLPLWTKEEDLKSLLASLEIFFELNSPSNLGQRSIRDVLSKRTNMTIGEIISILRDAAIAAIESGAERITPELLQRIPFDSDRARSM